MDERVKLTAFAVDESTETNADPVSEAEASPTPQLPTAQGDDVPDWAVVPRDLRVPKGRQVLFVRIPAAWTDTPLKGDRQCICWTLTDGDEKLAGDRCEGKAGRAGSEYTKQMVRAVDGHCATWMRNRGPGAIDEFWSEIGAKGRNMLMRLYTQLHLASDDEVRDFFENCIAVRSTG